MRTNQRILDDTKPIEYCGRERAHAHHTAAKKLPLNANTV